MQDRGIGVSFARSMQSIRPGPQPRSWYWYGERTCSYLRMACGKLLSCAARSADSLNIALALLRSGEEQHRFSYISSVLVSRQQYSGMRDWGMKHDPRVGVFGRVPLARLLVGIHGLLEIRAVLLVDLCDLLCPKGKQRRQSAALKHSTDTSRPHMGGTAGRTPLSSEEANALFLSAA